LRIASGSGGESGFHQTAHRFHQGMVPAEVIHKHPAAVSLWEGLPVDPAVRIPKDETLGRGRLQGADGFRRKKTGYQVFILPIPDMKQGRSHAPDLVPEETVSGHFQENKMILNPYMGRTNCTERILVLYPGKIREIVRPKKLSGSPVHGGRILRHAGKIITVRPRTGIEPGMELRGYLGIAGTPAVGGKLGVDDIYRPFRHHCRKRGNLPDGMNTAVCPASKQETCFAPVVKKGESLAG
jgi:hypothetical protein